MLTTTDHSRPVPAKERLTLGAIDSRHIRVLGIIAAIPQFPYPLETAHSLKHKNFIDTVSAHQESPIWDWAGELLAKA
jgi:hypothetical protein